MKNQMEVFFDYTCPFCLRGYGYLKELLPQNPQLEIAWRPCEAHPRPEQYGQHSDLCMQGMLFARDAGVDLWAYHDRMFDAAQGARIDIEDPAALAAGVDGLLDAKAFREALESGRYTKEQQDLNDYAYEQNGVWVLPAFRLNGQKLDSVGGVGVTKAQLLDFVAAAQRVAVH